MIGGFEKSRRIMPPVFFAISGPLKIEQFRKKTSEQVPVHSTRERRGSVFFFKNRPGMPFVAPGCHASLSLLVVTLTGERKKEKIL
jgi:hypothetical protein